MAILDSDLSVSISALILRKSPIKYMFVSTDSRSDVRLTSRSSSSNPRMTSRICRTSSRSCLTSSVPECERERDRGNRCGKRPEDITAADGATPSEQLREMSPLLEPKWLRIVLFEPSVMSRCHRGEGMSYDVLPSPGGSHNPAPSPRLCGPTNMDHGPSVGPQQWITAPLGAHSDGSRPL